jgi:OHCU decarboxylase
MRLPELNALDHAAAVTEFLRCCGSARWAEQMAAARPFADIESMARTADSVWARLSVVDYLEAFAAHPRIGERAGPAWSTQEQSGVTDAMRERFAQLNRAYEARFGYIFIICATGRGGAEMLEALERRLGNDASREMEIAAEEQRRITRLRLDKLIS